MPHSASRASRPAHPPSIAPASGAANGYLNAALFLTYLFVAVFILLSIFLAILGEYLDLGLEPRTEVLGQSATHGFGALIGTELRRASSRTDSTSTVRHAPAALARLLTAEPDEH